MTIEYLPGELNTFADALSIEERPCVRMTEPEEKMMSIPDISLPRRDVVGQPPQEIEDRKRRER